MFCYVANFVSTLLDELPSDSAGIGTDTTKRDATRTFEVASTIFSSTLMTIPPAAFTGESKEMDIKDQVGFDWLGWLVGLVGWV